MINKSIFRTVLNFICYLLLFVYRQCAIASLVFWIMICTYVDIIFLTATSRKSDEIFLMIIVSRVITFSLYYFLFVSCFSCVVCVMLFSMCIWNKTKCNFCISLIIYLIILVLCFVSIPVVQMS
jgi:hypothetical protein